MTKVLIAEDHPIVREGLKQVIAKDVDMTIAGEALNRQELLDKVYAAGYMTKESAPKELVQAIRKLYAGGKYVSPALAEKLALDPATASGRKPHETLSDREYQVLIMIASGKNMEEVAGELSVSVKTARTYRDRILVKMQLKNVVELTHYALQNGLIGNRDTG
jgi:two-component system invasion response regulator UvrY